jgi:hypothetical protein
MSDPVQTLRVLKTLRVFCSLALLSAALFQAGCSALLAAPPTPLPLDTPTLLAPTASPTTTPVWFPATETPTLAPTPSPRPTDDYRPALGEILLQDDFSSKSGWTVFANEAGRASYGINELTLAVSASKGVLGSLGAKTIPGNFYLELTAFPSLCAGADAFGLYVRASSPRDGYRLVATCDGRIRLERLKNGELVLLQDWTPSGEVPRGGMVPLRLGVWASGPELRIFVNAVYQFSARDPVWTEGQVGVYARAALDGPLTVSYSNLVVRAIDPTRLPTPTISPTSTP